MIIITKATESKSKKQFQQEKLELPFPCDILTSFWATLFSYTLQPCHLLVVLGSEAHSCLRAFSPAVPSARSTSSRSLLDKLTFAVKPLSDVSLQHLLCGSQNSLTAPPLYLWIVHSLFPPLFRIVNSRVQSPQHPQLPGEFLQTIGTW